MALSRKSQKAANKFLSGQDTFLRDLATADIKPLTMAPDELRDRLRVALSSLSFDEYSKTRENLINGLRRAGANVPALLLLIGAPVSSTGEVLPSDLAHLIRYLRINQPKSISSINELLITLLARDVVAPKRRLAA